MKNKRLPAGLGYISIPTRPLSLILRIVIVSVSVTTSLMQPRQMVSVTCDSCGVATEVPFTPVSGKPVYCRDCYSNRSSGGY